MLSSRVPNVDPASTDWLTFTEAVNKKMSRVLLGPTLLFEKVRKGAEKSRRFYACSACRDRKDCNFFQWEDDKVSETRRLAREAENQSKRAIFTTQNYSRLQELIKLRNLEQKHEQMKSLLLDMDYRYSQFYSKNEFCHYNMFNHHFFDGKQVSVAVLQAFLTESEGHKVAMVADPPFGGLVTPLANSFSLISQTWRKLQSSDSSNTDIPMMWIFPYFFELRILQCLPSCIMLDYQVDYDNHPLYKHGKTGRKQSPVRVFTNISPRDIVLPKDEGYRFCSVCQRFVISLNKHCPKCNICPSKDGREWKHCFMCQKCVKPSWRHCQHCGRCALPDHLCGDGPGDKGCFNCGSLEHKRKACLLKVTYRINRQSNAKSGGKHVSQRALSKPKAKRSGAARRHKKLVALSK
ncbi:rRNA N(6)-adenosine-methyltransferase ZCCHC4 isoform 5-T11 [Spinachia spinachia]